MQGRYHLGLGLAAGVAVGILTADTKVVPCLCTTFSCCLGSIFPDIESSSSKMGQTLKVTSFFSRILFGHRGAVHTPFLLVLIDVLLLMLITSFSLPLQLVFGFTLGYLLHLLQDTFTKRGIMWLYPFKKDRYSIFTMKSGHHDFVEFLISSIIFIIITGITFFIAHEILGITNYGLTIGNINIFNSIKHIIRP